jgi:hypothetical protein
MGREEGKAGKRMGVDGVDGRTERERDKVGAGGTSYRRTARKSADPSGQVNRDTFQGK